MKSLALASLIASFSLASALLLAGAQPGRAADPLPPCTGLSVLLYPGPCVTSGNECHQVKAIANCYMTGGSSGLYAIDVPDSPCLMLYRGTVQDGLCFCTLPVPNPPIPTPHASSDQCQPVF